MSTLPLKIRRANDEDIPFIFNSWLKSYKASGPISKGVVAAIYYENHHKLIQKIAMRATVYVACDKNDPTNIYGFMAGEYIEGILVIHYVYIKHSFRRLGIAKELFNSFNHDTSSASCYTHFTRAIERIAERYNMVYHPYLIMLDYDVKQNVEDAGVGIKE